MVLARVIFDFSMTLATPAQPGSLKGMRVIDDAVEAQFYIVSLRN
jgi:hypothetical protein